MQGKGTLLPAPYCFSSFPTWQPLAAPLFSFIGWRLSNLLAWGLLPKKFPLVLAAFYPFREYLWFQNPPVKVLPDFSLELLIFHLFFLSFFSPKPSSCKLLRPAILISPKKSSASFWILRNSQAESGGHPRGKHDPSFVAETAESRKRCPVS